MATEDFIAVTGDDWYQRRRQDAEGDFFRHISDQAGRGSRDDSGGSTRQGIYCFTAKGKLLEYKNAGQAPDVMRQVLVNALSKWANLPAAERLPGSTGIGELANIDSRYSRTPPAGGLILNVYTRALDRNEDGTYCDAQCKVGGGDEAARDHLWLSESEWKALVPASARTWDQFSLPPSVVERICRFHLTDNTRGEPPMWSRQDIRSSRMFLTVERRQESGMTLRLEGHAIMANQADVDKVNRGYDVQLVGQIHYNSAANKIDRFDVVAIGDHWGEGAYTRSARPGRTPLGIAMELASGKSPGDLVPPQGAREIGEYLQETQSLK
jgi:hypothetical protein